MSKSKQIILLASLFIIATATVYLGLNIATDYLKERKVPDTDNPFILGTYYFNHGLYADGTYDLKKAREYYEMGLRASSTASNIGWYQLGRIDFLEGKYDDAITKFRKQIEYFDNQVPPVYYMLGLTYGFRARRTEMKEDWLKAEENFLKYLELDPESPWARTDLTWIYFSQGKYEEMKEPLIKGLKNNPDNPWLLNMYGLALLNTGGKEEARNYFERALEEAKKLTPRDWGDSYPGNDPDTWDEGLEAFKLAISKNLELSKTE